MINSLIAWCARNSFFVLIGTIFLTAAGVVAVREVKLDAIPDLSDVQVIVFTEWPGRAPTLVEDQVTYPIVSTLAAAPKVKYARGQSFFGLSFVNVIFEDGTDMYWARSRVLEYMNQAKANLPAEVNPVLGPDATGVGWVYQYALVDETGQNSLADLRSYQDWTLRYYLQNTPGVAEVASIGGYVNGYQIEIDPNKLLGYNIPLGKVIAAVRKSNNDVGGRVIEFGETEYMVRGEGYVESLDDLRSVVIGLDDQGTPVTVDQVANVHRGPDMRRGLLEVDGKGEAVGGIVVMRYGENALKTINAVKEKLEAIKPALPPGVKIVTGYDRSSLILRAIANLRSTLVEEMIVVSLVIVIFLFHFRSALVAIIALPLAVLFSFIPMTLLGVSSNIMSLGGIAIAIGAMVDASVVLIENSHKWLRRWELARSTNDGDEFDRELAAMDRTTVIIKSAQQVGKPLFFSLLVIAVSFLPVFALEAQSGRLFKPLAFTKTFAMGFAAVLSITLVPLLLMLFIRGKIPDENRNPVNRFLVWIYRPFVAFALRFRWLVIIVALLTLVVTWFPYRQIGSEFMPPLNEGSLLYMPTSPPGMAISESREILQRQDAIIARLPEVERVFGKIGRARTATDPAPLSMVETVITLKPEAEWRPGMTFDKIKEELNKELPIPGMPTIWWMPIQTRIEMLATGIRSQIGIKVLGPDLNEIQKIGEQIEKLLKTAPNTASVFAERVTGGYYVDFKVNRAAIARHGLVVDDVNDVIETAIGGKNISTTVEGQQRFPINVRYARDFRSDLPALRRVLVTTPMGTQIPLGQLADIEITTGPPMIRNENGTKAGFVFVDTFGTDLGSYVANAKKLIAESITLPPGYFLDWGGQFQYLLKARETLKLIIPLTLVLIFLLIYIEFRNVTETLIILLSVPFSLVGGVWLLWSLDYNFSVAVAVGFIALAGVAAETGVVMIVYLDEAWAEVRKRIARPSMRDLTAAIMEGAVARVRPKMMTASTTIIGLLPVMWGVGSRLRGHEAHRRADGGGHGQFDHPHSHHHSGNLFAVAQPRGAGGRIARNDRRQKVARNLADVARSLRARRSLGWRMVPLAGRRIRRTETHGTRPRRAGRRLSHGGLQQAVAIRNRR
jgi:copper/silver efflux system protein